MTGPIAPTSPSIPVPKRLAKPHSFVRATRDAASGGRAGEDGRIAIGPKPGVVYLIVTRALLRRALRICQAMLAEADRRGWDVADYEQSGYGHRPGVAIVVRGHEYPLEIREMTETLPFTEEEVEEWRRGSWLGESRQGSPPAQHKRKRAIGRLALHMPTGYRGGRAKWTEGPRGPLEHKLASVFETLTERAEADDQAAKERAILEVERQREEAQREERARLQRIEQARAKRAREEIEAWAGSARARRYLAALRNRLPELDQSEQERLTAWCEWIEAWADRCDPTLNTERILGLDDRDEHQFPHPSRGISSD